MAELRCEQISASYGTGEVLSALDLVVPDGTLTAILGASGSGKTTLLRVIMGFVEQDHGSVIVGEKVVSRAGGPHLPPEKRSVGYVAQEGALYPHLSVAENVAFGLPRRERSSSPRIPEVLELVGLSERYADRRPHELSGGEQRRVALARALAPTPPLVLLDEPFSGLDAALRAETREAVLHALTGQGATAVMVTHDQAEALSTGREVGVLMSGQLVQTAAPAVLYRTPSNLDVARFVGEAVIVPGRARGGVVSCPLGALPLIGPSRDGAVDVLVRPEQIKIHAPEPHPPAPGTGEPRIVATVTERTFYGPDSVVELTVAGVELPIRARILGHGAPPSGEQVALTVVGEVAAYPRSHSTADDVAPAQGTELLSGPAPR